MSKRRTAPVRRESKPSLNYVDPRLRGDDERGVFGITGKKPRQDWLGGVTIFYFYEVIRNTIFQRPFIETTLARCSAKDKISEIACCPRTTNKSSHT